MVLDLEAERGDRKTNEAIFIRLKAVPLPQNIEQGHGKTDLGFKVIPHLVTRMLEITDIGQHRKDGFNHHTHIPFTTFAQAQIGWVPVQFAKTGISENNHLLGNIIDQLLESRAIINIGGITSPTYNQTKMIEEVTEFSANKPSPV